VFRIEEVIDVRDQVSETRYGLEICGDQTDCINASAVLLDGLHFVLSQGLTSSKIC
jgi:hypothetical protein